MAILGYARVSTQDQNLTGQLEALKAAGADLIYREKISGARAVQPPPWRAPSRVTSVGASPASSGCRSRAWQRAKFSPCHRQSAMPRYANGAMKRCSPASAPSCRPLSRVHETARRRDDGGMAG